MKGQLPKAYLRLDPLIDSHPDWPAMVTLMLWANRQPRRGRFKALDVVRKLLGSKRLDACMARRDLAEQPDGTFLLVGWDEWQEGDLTVGDRVRALRARRSTTVTGPLQDRSSPSEALGVKASGVETERERAPVLGVPAGAEDGRTDDERKGYADAIWDAFMRASDQRPTRTMSPGEWETLRGWMVKGVPLRVVLRGLEDTKGKGRMLGYYNSSVMAAYEQWRQALGPS